MSDIVQAPQQQPAYNPFQRTGPDLSGLAVGAVSIESERAIAEAQGALTLAKRFPRDQARAFARVQETCARKGFAETASYAFPRGGQTVSGPSIRLAEELARVWGNIDYGIRELSRQPGFSEMEAYAWDLETNTRTSQRFTVEHKSLAKGNKEISDPRDIYERTANDAARRLRSRILAILPPDLVDEAERSCRATLAGGSSEPLVDRARRMVAAFAKLGVNVDLLTQRLGHSIETALPEEFADLQQIYCSIRDGMTKASEWFEPRGQAAPAKTLEQILKPVSPAESPAGPAEHQLEPASPAGTSTEPRKTATARKKPLEPSIELETLDV